MGQPRPLLSFIFGLFKQTSLQFYNKYMGKYPSSIWCRDSNPQPSEHESLPKTTRPGLPPKIVHCLTLPVVAPNLLSWRLHLLLRLATSRTIVRGIFMQFAELKTCAAALLQCDQKKIAKCL